WAPANLFAKEPALISGPVVILFVAGAFKILISLGNNLKIIYLCTYFSAVAEYPGSITKEE
ncbi:MAG: hypothetical protein J1E33_03915, partial [Alistipes sp.]|nr:hypothetical protein [Alistipes sp.]